MLLSVFQNKLSGEDTFIILLIVIDELDKNRAENEQRQLALYLYFQCESQAGKASEEGCADM